MQYIIYTAWQFDILVLVGRHCQRCRYIDYSQVMTDDVVCARTDLVFNCRTLDQPGKVCHSMSGSSSHPLQLSDGSLQIIFSSNMPTNIKFNIVLLFLLMAYAYKGGIGRFYGALHWAEWQILAPLQKSASCESKTKKNLSKWRSTNFLYLLAPPSARRPGRPPTRALLATPLHTEPHDWFHSPCAEAQAINMHWRLRSKTFDIFNAIPLYIVLFISKYL